MAHGHESNIAKAKQVRKGMVHVWLSTIRDQHLGRRSISDFLESVESLRQRIAALSAENASLRQQVETLKSQLLLHAGGTDQTADSAPV